MGIVSREMEKKVLVVLCIVERQSESEKEKKGRGTGLLNKDRGML